MSELISADRRRVVCAAACVMLCALAMMLAGVVAEARAELTEDSFSNIPSPFAVTGLAQGITGSSAGLTGMVYPGGEETGLYDTKYRFEYGTTTSYGSDSSEGDAGSAIIGKAVTRGISGLFPGTTYHYRIVAWNSKGTYYGSDGTFMTQAASPAVAPSAIYEPATGRNVFYVNSNGKMGEWWVHDGNWEDVELGAGGGANESAATGTGPSAIYEPATGRNVFYVGANNAVWQWYINGAKWENAELWAFNKATNNEPTAITPSTVYESATGRNVFYVGGNGKIWEWWVHNGQWEDVELGSNNNGGANESAWSGSGPSAIYEAATGRNVFYVGANGAIWQWYVNGSHWENGELWSLNKSTNNEPTQASPSAIYESATGRNVFYVGTNGKIWEWWVHNGQWEDVELGSNNNGGANTSGAMVPPAVVYEQATGRNVFYLDPSGDMWEWWVHGSYWEDVSLGHSQELAAANTAPSVVYEEATGRNVFYISGSGLLWTWYVNGSEWKNWPL